MAWNKETALAAQKKSEETRQGTGTKIGKAELLELVSARLRDPALTDSRFVILSNMWMSLTGRSRPRLKAASRVEASSVDSIDAMVQILEKEKSNG